MRGVIQIMAVRAADHHIITAACQHIPMRRRRQEGETSRQQNKPAAQRPIAWKKATVRSVSTPHGSSAGKRTNRNCLKHRRL
jgi:hypothetical protein